MDIKCTTTYLNYNFLPQIHHVLQDSDKYALSFWISIKLDFSVEFPLVSYALYTPV